MPGEVLNYRLKAGWLVWRRLAALDAAGGNN
jgi:hypothetical protein